MADVITMPRKTGLFTSMFNWLSHPQFTDKDPIDWLAFAILLMLFGLLWSKVIKQTLDSTIETIEEVAA